MSELDEDFENTRYIPGGTRFPSLWIDAAAAFRQRHPPQKIADADLYLPQGRPKGLMIFVHGGYWMECSPEAFSHLAGGALARGWAVGMPSYPLAPEARISQMVAHVTKTVHDLAQHVSGPISLTGHSAGGHLATRMICADSALPPEVLARIAICAPISGLFDLPPLMRTSMQAILRLDQDEAVRQSPLFSTPAADIALLAWVGAEERPEFLRQSRAFAKVWQGYQRQTELVEEPQRHHFDVIEALIDPDHPLVRRLTPDPVSPIP